MRKFAEYVMCKSEFIPKNMRADKRIMARIGYTVVPKVINSKMIFNSFAIRIILL
ncbi:MAG: hypothetical protein H0V82_05225 [Candidatus Protochlamydia sp.]|nr:hypothetical protein [Candidatus Protochlamydia sp.]